MTTFKLKPTQKRMMLAAVVSHRVKLNKDIIPYVGYNLGDFNYEDLYFQYLAEGIFSRDIVSLFAVAKHPNTNETTEEVEVPFQKYSKLTEMETKVFDFLLDGLAPWIGGEGYSDIDTKDIVKGTKIPATKLRGVLSSLEQKNILDCYEHDTNEGFTFSTEPKKRKWITLWSFVDQEETTTEELIAKVK
tara:strand:+ start:5865 stop:6431 length:567 start_codon:yes stop_codon:yes gene_type:complete